MNKQNTILEDLEFRYEEISSRIMNERYNQTVGLPFEKDVIKTNLDELAGICRTFLENFSEPRGFYLSAIQTLARNYYLQHDLEFSEKRIKNIVSNSIEVDNKKVNWASWRRYNFQSKNNEERKKVFDEFIKKSDSLIPSLEKRFQKTEQVYREFEAETLTMKIMDPLENYLEREGFKYNELTKFIKILGEGAKESFLAAAEYYAPEILNKSTFEYYDDFYNYRSKIFIPINRELKNIKPLDPIKQHLKWLGYDSSKIYVDGENRENKSPSAFCFAVKMPNDVRISYKPTAPFTDLSSVYHEFGHAMHGRSGLIEDNISKRLFVPMSVSESFAIFNEVFVENPIYLKKVLKFKDSVIKEILDRRRFVNLFFLVFYASNSLMKIEFWKNNYTIEEASKRYQELTKRFFIEVPGNYWLLHHVMPNYDLYSPSYLIAAVRVNSMINEFEEQFGKEFWLNKDSSSKFRKLASSRGDFNLKEFDLNPEKYLEQQKRLSFLN